MSQSKTTKQSVDADTRNTGMSILGQAQSYANTPFKAFDPNSISAYESPYTNDVVNAGVADLNKTRQMGILGNNGSATMAHAFGGSRQGVADSLTNNDFLRAVSDYIANTRNTGFTNASNMAMTNYQAQQQDPLQKLGILGSIFGTSVLPTATTTQKMNGSPDWGSLIQAAGSAASAIAAM